MTVYSSWPSSNICCLLFLKLFALHCKSAENISLSKISFNYWVITYYGNFLSFLKKKKRKSLGSSSGVENFHFCFDILSLSLDLFQSLGVRKRHFKVFSFVFPFLSSISFSPEMNVRFLVLVRSVRPFYQAYETRMINKSNFINVSPKSMMIFMLQFCMTSECLNKYPKGPWYKKKFPTLL